MATRTSAAPRSSRELLPAIRLARAAFLRELPELLRLRGTQRRWVAYSGAKRLGFAATKQQLYEKHFQPGMSRSDLYVRRIASPTALEAEVLFDAS